MTRRSALEAVRAVERQARARVAAAALRVGRLTSQRRRIDCERTAELRAFAAGRSHSSFACATAAACDSFARAGRARVLENASEAEAAHARAADALLPWARLRTGLERRLARRAETPQA